MGEVIPLRGSGGRSEKVSDGAADGQGRVSPSTCQHSGRPDRPPEPRYFVQPAEDRLYSMQHPAEIFRIGPLADNPYNAFALPWVVWGMAMMTWGAMMIRMSGR